MSTGWWNLLVWAVYWLGSFCVLEGLAVFGRRVGVAVPWTTFSRAVWDAQASWEFLTVPVVAILAILASHLIRLGNIQEGDRIPLPEHIRRTRKAARVGHAVKVLAQVQAEAKVAR
jgi:hypothetical protein